MKKLSLLLVVLLAAGSAGLYGQMAIGTNFSISGEATATAGYDIDDEQFGFKNESSANIKIVLVAKQSTNNDETGRHVRRMVRLHRVERLPDHHRQR